MGREPSPGGDRRSVSWRLIGALTLAALGIVSVVYVGLLAESEGGAGRNGDSVIDEHCALSVARRNHLEVVEPELRRCLAGVERPTVIRISIMILNGRIDRWRLAYTRALEEGGALECINSVATRIESRIEAPDFVEGEMKGEVNTFEFLLSANGEFSVDKEAWCGGFVSEKNLIPAVSQVFDTALRTCEHQLPTRLEKAGFVARLDPIPDASNLLLTRVSGLAAGPYEKCVEEMLAKHPSRHQFNDITSPTYRSWLIATPSQARLSYFVMKREVEGWAHGAALPE